MSGAKRKASEPAADDVASKSARSEQVGVHEWLARLAARRGDCGDEAADLHPVSERYAHGADVLRRNAQMGAHEFAHFATEDAFMREVALPLYAMFVRAPRTRARPDAGALSALL